MFDSEQLIPLTLHEMPPDFFSEKVDNCTAVGVNELNRSSDFRAKMRRWVCACVCACECVGVKRRTDDRGIVGWWCNHLISTKVGWTGSHHQRTVLGMRAGHELCDEITSSLFSMETKLIWLTVPTLSGWFAVSDGDVCLFYHLLESCWFNNCAFCCGCIPGN